jgi:hypothetical protein
VFSGQTQIQKLTRTNFQSPIWKKKLTKKIRKDNFDKMVYLGSEAASLHSHKHSNNGDDRNGSNGDFGHHGTPHSGSRAISPASLSLDRELGPHQGHREQGRDDSSGEDEREGRIRVGKDYQVMPPEWIPPESEFLNKNLLHRNSLLKNFVRSQQGYY